MRRLLAVLALVLVAAARPPVPGGVIEDFAPPATPYGPGHRGVDLSAAPGDEVRAALPGTVTFSGDVAGIGYVTVDHGGGLATTYGDLDPRMVAAGQRVGVETVLGRLAASATHLDWGARLDGAYVDPLGLLAAWELHLVDSDAPLPALTTTDGGGPLLTPVAAAVSSGFGPRTHPITGERRVHAGVDFAAPAGTPVVAAAAGVVRVAGRHGGYGLLVVLDHGDGIQTRYAHASRLLVAAGQAVARGQLIALVGSTGRSTGPHLHFEVRVGGVAQDPLAWL